MRSRSSWTRHGLALAAALLVGGTALAALPASVGAEETPDAAAVVAQTFSYTGAAQTFIVPETICGLTIEAFGAQGGTGTGAVASDVFIDGTPAATAGGLGGHTTATISVTSGEVLTVNVGGKGGDGTATASVLTNGDDPAQANATAGGGVPGFNGGGSGGTGTIEVTTPSDAFDQAAIAAAVASGGGGGASDVRQGGTGVEHRVVVAGGGGGGGGYSAWGFASRNSGMDVGRLAADSVLYVGGNGGVGGGASGGAGTEGESSGGGTAGGGGTQTAGGAAGVGVDPFPATAGVAGAGGSGGGWGVVTGDFDPDVTAFTSAGGGGGGGWFGGGGGTAPGVRDVDVAPDTGAGPGGGGGGSGYALTGVLTSGVREGNGQVVISYDPVADACPAVVSPKFTG